MHVNPAAPIEIILTLTACAAAAFWWRGLRRLRGEWRLHPLWAVLGAGLLMLVIPPLAAWTLSSLWLQGAGSLAAMVAGSATLACVYGLLALLPPRSRLQVSPRTASRAQSGCFALALMLLATSAFLRWRAPDILNPWLDTLLLVGASMSLLLAVSARARAWLSRLWVASAH